MRSSVRASLVSTLFLVAYAAWGADGQLPFAPVQVSPAKPLAYSGTMLSTAYTHLQKKEYGEAEKIFFEVRKDPAMEPQALEGLMWLEMSRNRLKRAFAYSEMRNKLRRDIDWIPRYLEVQRLNPEQRKNVLSLYEKYTKARPNDHRAKLMYADFCSWIPETRGRAIPIYKDLIRTNARNYEAWVGLVAVLMRNKQRAEALSFYNRLPRAAKTPQTDYTLAKALHDSGELLDARAFVQKARYRYPNDALLKDEQIRIDKDINEQGGVREIAMEKKREYDRKTGWVVDSITPTLEVLTESSGFARVSLYSPFRLVHLDKWAVDFGISYDRFVLTENLNRFNFGLRTTYDFTNNIAVRAFYQLNLVSQGNTGHNFEIGPQFSFSDKAKKFIGGSGWVYFGGRQLSMLTSEPDVDLVPFQNKAGSSGLSPAGIRQGFSTTEGFLTSAFGGELGYVYESAAIGSTNDANSRLTLAAGTGFRIPAVSLIPRSSFFGRLDYYYVRHARMSPDYFSPPSFWMIRPSISGEIQEFGKFDFGANLGMAFNSFNQIGPTVSLQTRFRLSPFSSLSVRIQRNQTNTWNVFESLVSFAAGW